MSRWNFFFFFEKKPECLWQLFGKSLRSEEKRKNENWDEEEVLLKTAIFICQLKNIRVKEPQVNIGVDVVVVVGVGCHLEKKNKKPWKEKKKKYFSIRNR